MFRLVLVDAISFCYIISQFNRGIYLMKFRLILNSKKMQRNKEKRKKKSERIAITTQQIKLKLVQHKVWNFHVFIHN